MLLYNGKSWVVRGGAQSYGGVPPPGGTTYYEEDGKPWVWQRLRVPLSSGGNIRHGDPPHWGIHQEEAGNHIGKDGLSPHI